MNKRLLMNTLTRSVLRNKSRSGFMMIGIIISVYTLTIGLGTGLKLRADFNEFLQKSFLPNSISLASSRSALEDDPLRPDELEAVINSVSGIQLWTPIIRGGRKTLSLQGSTTVTTLLGLGVSAQEVMGQPVILGEYLSPEDIQTRSRVVLIGTTTAVKLFAGIAENHHEIGNVAIGSQIEIDRSLFRVKGILKSLGSDPHGGDLDNVIVIPYTTLQQMNKTMLLNNVRFMADTGADVERIADDIRRVMKQERTTLDEQPESFTVSTAHEGQVMFDQFFSLFDLILLSVIGIVFLISALVISVIMKISIKERTAEIGLRKAMGATANNLNQQFLLEALLVSSLGAIFGLGFSLISLPFLSNLLSEMMGGEILLSANSTVMAIAVGCSIVAGLLGGYFPAKKAAAMIPVEALRG